jgi:hypothetical protein
MEAKFVKISTTPRKQPGTASKNVSNLYKFARDLLLKMPENSQIRFLFIHKETRLVTLSCAMTFHHSAARRPAVGY